MFKRRGKGNKKTKIVKEKKKGTFKRWFKGVFKKKSPNKKIISPERIPTKAPSKIQSVATLFRNNIKKTKMNVRDIELIEGMDAHDLKKRFSVTGSKAKLLDGMVTDYKGGRLSLPGLSHKSKFDGKSLDRTRLNQMIKDYDELKRKRDLEDAKKNAKEIKKKFSMTASQGSKLDKVIEGLSKEKGSKLELAKTLLDPKKLTKERVKKLIKQYEEAERKNRGLSYMITKSKLSFLVSKDRIHNLMEDIKVIGLSGILKR